MYKYSWLKEDKLNFWFQIISWSVYYTQTRIKRSKYINFNYNGLIYIKTVHDKTLKYEVSIHKEQ